MGEDRRRASAPGGGVDHPRRARPQDWPGGLLFSAGAGQTQADWRRPRACPCPRLVELSEPPAHLPRRALVLRKSSQRVRGGLGGDRDPVPPRAAALSAKRWQRSWVCSQSSFGALPCARLGPGSRGRWEHYGLWGCSGDLWEGLEQEGLPTPFHHPVSPATPGHTPPISCILCPGPTHPRASESCPAAPSTPSTPSIFLLHLPGGSRPAMSALSHLLSLDCCTPQNKVLCGSS